MATQYQVNLRCAIMELDISMTMGLVINEQIFKNSELMSFCSEYRANNYYSFQQEFYF